MKTLTSPPVSQHPVTRAAEPAPATPASPVISPVPVASPVTTDGFHARGVEARLKDGAVTTTRPAPAEWSSEERTKLSKKIPCPALAAMFNAKMFPVSDDGTVQVAELKQALVQLGLSNTVQGILTHGADKVDDVKGSFNILSLNGSNLDHTGSSGVRQNGVHEERFDLMASFSKDGERLTPADLAEAAKHFAKEDPGLRGALTQLAEMSILLNTFGCRDEQGKLFFDLKDAKRLWVEGQLPIGWRPPATPGQIGVDDVLGLAAKMKLEQIF